MDWAREKDSWPLAEISHFTQTRTHDWHVQRTGDGPGILLLHGAGASTHSWRDLIPILAARAEVMAIDLPGHGFTRARVRGRYGLPQMAEDVAGLLEVEAFAPTLLVGHSAGAAIALRMVLNGSKAGAVYGLNPALMPFEGLAGILFPPLAKLLALNPFAPLVFSRTASSDTAVRNLIEGTGSHLDADALSYYRRLIAQRSHVDGALKMMANWNLDPLLASLPDIRTPVTFAIGLKDKAVPPDTTRSQVQRMPTAHLAEFPIYGHLMHEEAPEVFAKLILDALDHAVAPGVDD